MPTIDCGGRQLDVNEEGFLLHPEQWDENLATFLARAEEGLETLTRTLQGDLARPRRYEIAAALNRLPSLRIARLA